MKLESLWTDDIMKETTFMEGEKKSKDAYCMSVREAIG